MRCASTPAVSIPPPPPPAKLLRSTLLPALMLNVLPDKLNVCAGTSSTLKSTLLPFDISNTFVPLFQLNV